MTWTPEELRFVDEALAAADSGSAGSWPTVAGYLADEVRRLRALNPEPDGYGLVERFWAAGWPDLAACDDECGTCKPCVTHWAVTWSLAALSNPALVEKAEQDGAWKWTTKPIEPTFTASELKERLETATAVALALGRKEALTEIADEMAVEQDDERLSYVTIQTDRETWGILLAAKTFSQPTGGGSERLTAPTGHSDLPPTPEAARDEEPVCDCRYGDGPEFTKHEHTCSWGRWHLIQRAFTPDLPEGE